jgi:hypothetical protein
VLCRCVCVKESVYERESGERKVSWSVGQLVERSSSLFWVFLVPSFAPKKSFFFLISCFFFARRLCLFRVVRCFRESLHVDRKKCLKRREANATHSRAFKQREQHIKGW